MQERQGSSSRRPAPRLPTIAPRHDARAATQDAAGLSSSEPGLIETPRSRLPPRSRSGCWTCRQRKVKCDEQQPTCGQCSRLNHHCDYNPRLAFRDDTSRVKERMQEVQTDGSMVWDPTSPGVRYVVDRTAEDLLPPFAALRNDEERERKAQLRDPGTYVVIANPSSFATLPEYRETALGASDTPLVFSGYDDPFGTRRASIATTASSFDASQDPNIVILATFEEPSRRASAPVPSTITSSPATSFSARTQISFDTKARLPITADRAQDPLSLLEEAQRGGRDSHLLHHYRSALSRHIVNIGNTNVREDLFELQAKSFPPLFHAMMALSALSLAHRSGVSSTEAMEHYGHVLTALRQIDIEGSESDGAVYTHYLLLLYEIGHAGPRESGMWQGHCEALVRILTSRQSLTDPNAHGLVTWMICLVDTYALLSGSGTGTFIQPMLQRGLLPLSANILPPIVPGRTDRWFPEEIPFFPDVLEMNLQIVSLAAQVAGTARDLRAEEAGCRDEGGFLSQHNRIYAADRQARVRTIQELCRSLSRSLERAYPQHWPWPAQSQTYPYRAQAFLTHAQTLYRACVIYAHTSMYPGQMLEAAPEYTHEVTASITEICEIAIQVIHEAHWDYQQLTFALFMAGFASTNKMEKDLVANLLVTLEPHGFGGHTRILRQVLQVIYAKQMSGFNIHGYNFDVDWVAELASTGRSLVLFGL